MEPSPKADEPEEEEEEDGDESEALLGSDKNKKSPVISPLSVKVVPSRDTVKVEGEHEQPAAQPRVKKPYLNTDV